jgi:predicted dehydrogenase
MTPVRVGLVGCGVIAHNYVEGSAGFPSFEIVQVADLEGAVAETFGEKHGLPVSTVDALIASPDIDVVLNLTPPAAHAALVSATLSAGKHAYTEKPLAISLEAGRELVRQAHDAGLRIGSAPDTFLGGAYETGRRLIAEGAIGTPVGAMARFMTGGPESWHPNADFFYRAGAGPLLDIGPYYLTAMAALLGPITATAGFSAVPTTEREIAVGPRAGERFGTEVPTHVSATLRFASGALGTFTVSFETQNRYESGLVIHGTEASLQLPDANGFGGDVLIRRDRGDWEPVEYELAGAMETRGIGLHDMVTSLRAGRPHRASGELALHVLEAMHAILQSAEEGRMVELEPLQPQVEAPVSG